LVTSSFPSIFGPNGDKPVDLETVTAKFEQLTRDINSELMVELTPQQVALGFLKIANENMGRPIRNATEARGFATENHNLVTYGGAGPRRYFFLYVEPVN
jgi:5-oxoprolinase (ATP-hydrolysing)